MCPIFKTKDKFSCLAPKGTKTSPFSKNVRNASTLGTQGSIQDIGRSLSRMVLSTQATQELHSLLRSTFSSPPMCVHQEREQGRRHRAYAMHVSFELVSYSFGGGSEGCDSQRNSTVQSDQLLSSMTLNSWKVISPSPRTPADRIISSTSSCVSGLSPLEIITCLHEPRRTKKSVENGPWEVWEH